METTYVVLIFVFVIAAVILSVGLAVESGVYLPRVHITGGHDFSEILDPQRLF